MRFHTTAPFFLLIAACGFTSKGLETTPETPSSSPGLQIECQGGSLDADADGLGDDCELAIAQAFAPALRVRSGGCNWDDSVTPPQLGGGYLFAVESRRGGAIRVAYLPAYFRDCGWSGVKCWLPIVNCDPHVGDSEMIILDVVRQPADRGWHVDGIFLSAHCFGRSGSNCRWYRGDDLEAFTWVGSQVGHAPVIWVAEGRQANYPSWQACDRGHSSIDTCDQHDTEYRFPVLTSRQNIGSAANPIACATASALGSTSRMPDPDAEECVWDDEARFFGWQGRHEGDGATPYARYLSEIAEFGRAR